MNNIKKIIAIVLLLAIYIILSPTSEQGIDMKIGLLCQDNPELDCKEIASYCRESLEKGHDCLIYNQN
jgi:hypothetical protein